MNKIASVLVVLAVLFAVSSCGQVNENSAQSDGKIPFDCGDNYTNVVVTVNQWSSLVSKFVNTPTEGDYGRCYKMSTIIFDTNANPHNYQPVSDDIDKLRNANIVVANGAGYDDWANQYINESATIIRAADMLNEYDDEGNPMYAIPERNNPHLWYSYNVIYYMLSQLNRYLYNPTAYTDLSSEIAELVDLIAKATDITSMKSFVATENVANLLLADLQMSNRTPMDYANTVSDEELTPDELNTIKQEVRDADVVIVNLQENSKSSQEIANSARDSNVKVIEVYEQLPDGQNLIGYLKSIVNQINN
jgi:zinc/manganese transport system substrate-binding protein